MSVSVCGDARCSLDSIGYDYIRSFLGQLTNDEVLLAESIGIDAVLAGRRVQSADGFGWYLTPDFMRHAARCLGMSIPLAQQLLRREMKEAVDFQAHEMKIPLPRLLSEPELLRRFAAHALGMVMHAYGIPNVETDTQRPVDAVVH